MRQDERIGIVGGVGPHAGLDLTRKLFDHTRAEADQEHLPVMLYSFPDRIGERPAFLLGKTADNPGEAIGDIMAELARAGATVIGMPCNTAHSPRILDAALEKLNATGRPVRFVHMIDAVVRHVRQRCGEGARVGILSTLATLETRLYQDSLERAGLRALHPAPDGCARVQEAISNREYGIKARNPVTERARADLLDEARRLAGNADAIILGCTEIPLALPEKELGGVPLIDATGAGQGLRPRKAPLTVPTGATHAVHIHRNPKENTMKTILSTADAPAAIGPYSQAVRSGEALYCSGQLGIDPATGKLPEGVAAQTEQSLKNIRALLAAAGAGIENVVKTTVFITNMADFPLVNAEYSKVFAENPPARSCVAVKELPLGGLVEIEVLAVV